MKENMKARWLLEKVDIDTDMRYLVSALKAADIEHSITSSVDVSTDRFPINIDVNEGCVVAYGSLRFVDAIQRGTRLIPGAWVDFRALECHRYLSYLSEFSIHREFCFLTLGSLFTQWNKVFDRYGHSIFIKPNESRKSFSGMVISRHDEISFYEKTAHLGPEELCLISKPSALPIETEWRFTCTKNGVITGSQYEPEIKSSLDPKAVDLANVIACRFFAEAKLRIPTEHPVIIDIGKVGDEYKMIELGGFGCAGLYECNYDLLVRKLSECAEREWKEYQR